MRVSQSGCAVDVTGVKDSSDVIPATVEGDTVIVGPHDFPEDGGMTTSTFTLTLTSPTTLEGEEAWSWAGGGSTCINGSSTVSGTKIP